MANTRAGTEDPDILRGHVLRPLKVVTFLHIFELLIAIAILGLAGFVITFIAYSGASLELFTASATILIIFYILISTHHFSVIYNYWAIACLDVFLITFWFVAFIVTSNQVSHNRYNGYWYCGPVYCTYYKRDLLELEERDAGYGGALMERDGGISKRSTTTYGTFRNVMIAAAVLGATELFIIIMKMADTVTPRRNRDRWRCSRMDRRREIPHMRSRGMEERMNRVL
ncbi:integral membrane protein [Rutstroemia sp. NJR-2017a BBW]|nr:integral membrane protein [Rutstroemia sp. NJR-2017a BBW]